MSNCFVQKDFTEISALPEIVSLERLVIRDVGLIHITDIEKKLPLLEALDV